MKKTNIVILLCLGLLTFMTQAQSPGMMSPKKNQDKPATILMDISHGQRFWNDPSKMEASNDQLPRVKAMTEELSKTGKSVNAKLAYTQGPIDDAQLKNADVLFIHIPTLQYAPGEVKAIRNYLEKGGSLFIVTEVDYWATLQQTNVNDLLEPFGIQYKGTIPDSLIGGYTKAGVITPKPLKISYHEGRIVEGGTPFCFGVQSEKYPFGVYKELKGGGRIIAMGEGMVSLYMTSWQGVNDYQCSEFMHDVFRWLLTKK
ncbi:hypothetical protein GVN16_04005 [Emticicia sp. CRIBPO]|uniref:hypothetical protein n=1 Tax=Emticicia sp. CRIBPO TaxID=2683258 RepID=UPI001413090F|nr:hypothetical protein [Emticicia sp. CRIBPO]NBA84906.1 hypothetical protein [Emticicia sp. CRIBPO]